MPFQELSLTIPSLISPSRHPQLQHVLSGVAAMPPHPFLERHIIFQPVAREDVREQRGLNPGGGGEEGKTEGGPQIGGSQTLEPEKKFRRGGGGGEALPGAAARGGVKAGGGPPVSARGDWGESGSDTDALTSATFGGDIAKARRAMGPAEMQKWESRAKGDVGRPSPRWIVRLVERLEGPGWGGDESEGDGDYSDYDDDDEEEEKGEEGAPEEGEAWLSDGEEFDDVDEEHRRGRGKKTRNVRWQLRWHDTPEAGQPNVTSRAVDTLNIDEDESDPVGFVEARGFRYSAQYLLQGTIVFHHHTTLDLYRIHQIPSSITHKKPLPVHPPPEDPKPTSTSSKEPASTVIDLDESPSPESDSGSAPPLPDTSTYPLLAQGYILSASLRVEIAEEAQRAGLMENGVAELAEVRDLLKGVVELGVADRLSLDTRVM